MVIEGLDGSGKTTLILGLSRYLKELGFKVIITSEPTGGPVGQLIKEYLQKAPERDPVYEALMFAADRRWHCRCVIEPALKSGLVVLCDRYVFSSLAYQGTAGLDRAWISKINSFALKPDIAFFLDAPPQVCKNRLGQRGLSILERDYAQEAAYKAYLDMVKSGHLTRIDATLSREAVLEKAINLIRKRGVLTLST